MGECYNKYWKKRNEQEMMHTIDGRLNAILNDRKIEAKEKEQREKLKEEIRMMK